MNIFPEREREIDIWSNYSDEKGNRCRNLEDLKE